MKITRRKVTASTSSSNAINVNKTGVSYYNNFLNEKDAEYMKKSKNRLGHIEQMSPKEYFEKCAKDVFNVPVNRLLDQRKADKESIDNLEKILEDDGQFWLPYINLAENSQEGLHRMMVLGDKFGWDKKYPVLIVETADPRRDEVNEAFRQLNRAVMNARNYRYNKNKLPEDFIVQTQYELEKYDDETEYVAKLKDSNDEGFVVTLEGFEGDLEIREWYGNLRITEEDEDDDSWMDELEDVDVDIDNIEDLFFK